MEKNSKILIAGYKGMVGSAIYKTLQIKGYDNFILADKDDVDFTRQADTEEFFAQLKPDYVFLAAAKVGGIVANNTYKAEFIFDNMSIAMNIINSANKSGVKKLLNLGSSCIYPKFAPQPMQENHLLTGELEPTNEPYAIAKISAIKLCRYFNEQYGTDFISVMPTNLFGLNDNYNLETSHVLPALIRKMILGKALRNNNFEFLREDIKKRPLGYKLEDNITDNDSIVSALAELGITAEYVKIWGTGKVMREFLHADDMAAACVFLMENKSYDEIGEFVNIGTGEDLSIAELAETIQKVTGYEGELRFDADKPEGTPRKLLDVSRIKSLGWKPEISLEEGIGKVVGSYLS